MAPNFLITQRKDKTEWYDFSNVTKVLQNDDNFSFVVRILLNPQELTILRLSSNKS